jgi:hypothetical protein
MARLSKQQRKELEELSQFIDAHGGRLGAYRPSAPMPRESEPESTEDTEPRPARVQAERRERWREGD